jgi:hypothetical protein
MNPVIDAMLFMGWVLFQGWFWMKVWLFAVWLAES